jgi:hypothetical protein
MPRSLTSVARMLMVFSLCAALGLHWAALQSVAWVGMLLSYSQNTPLVEAVCKTFDGKHPCCLCRAIGSSKQSEKKKEAKQAPSKIDLICKVSEVFFFPPTPPLIRKSASLLYSVRTESPPVPPPRFA